MKLLYSKRISIDSRTRDLSLEIYKPAQAVSRRSMLDGRASDQMNIQESSDRSRWLYWKKWSRCPRRRESSNLLLLRSLSIFFFFSLCDLFERYTHRGQSLLTETSEILAKSVPINSSLYTKIMCAIISNNKLYNNNARSIEKLENRKGINAV